ncbi:hypothetical protein AAVH_33762 [Aphelenchoides avenae]|nr:hypothetical protein AAVH_33762 [Aphelenchus avenae]
MASRSSRPRHGRSAHPSRDASSDVSSASSVSESDVSVSSSASSLAEQPPVAKHAKRGAGRKSHSTTSVKSGKSSQSKGPRRSARLATKRKPAGFYARVPKIDHDEPSNGKRKRKGSTRSPKKSSPAVAHRRSTGSKKHSSRPRK